jgi:hypothetical protein
LSQPGGPMLRDGRARATQRRSRSRRIAPAGLVCGRASGGMQRRGRSFAVLRMTCCAQDDARCGLTRWLRSAPWTVDRLVSASNAVLGVTCVLCAVSRRIYLY